MLGSDSAVAFGDYSPCKGSAEAAVVASDPARGNGLWVGSADYDEFDSGGRYVFL